MNVHLDLFSGIGGFSQGLKQAGFNLVSYYSEIDKHAKAIYQFQHKEAIDVGPVEHVRDSGIDRPNIITFGSPCQDFSIAGKRAGMGGARSSLITYAIELIDRFRPDVFIWENVKGTFSSNDGRDFWAIIQAFTNIGGYRLEWQLLNTSWFLPQNRERLYLVGHLADGSEREVFPIAEANQIIVSKQQRFSGTLQADQCSANCITARMYKMGRSDNYINVVPVLTPNRAKKRQNGRRFKEPGEDAFTLTAQDQHGVMIEQRPRGNNKGGSHDACPTISSSGFEYNNNVNSIRRLTEIECERLQGFPDNFTQLGNYNGEIKEVASTNRYKCLGNAVTVDVVEEIARRLAV